MVLDAHKGVWIRHLQKGRDPTCLRWIEEAVDDDIRYVCLREERSCCILELDMGSKQASLSFLYRDTESKGLVLAAVAAAHERGIRYIDIVDNSTHCDISFLRTGKTWYESILPLEYMSDSPIEEYRKRVITNSWKYVSDRIAWIDPTYQFDTAGIDTLAPGSAMAVFQRVSEIKNIELLLVSSGITSLRGDSWRFVTNCTAGTLQEQEQVQVQEPHPV